MNTMKFLLEAGKVLEREKFLITSSLPKDDYLITTIAELKDLKEDLIDYVPIGSVEFCRELMRVLDVDEPESFSYLNYIDLREPQRQTIDSSIAQEGRQIYLAYAQDIIRLKNPLDEYFIKSQRTKKFEAFKVPTSFLKEFNDPYVIPLSYYSEIVNFEAEFRFYILNKEIVGYSQYGEGPQLEPDIKVVKDVILQFSNQPVGYSIDVGIVKDKTLLVELNDGWALGYYPWGTCKFNDYVELMTERWEQIKESKK